ncbi:MAG TPA: sigma-70 family RNA polymerase sigma factor [Solirubrobacterales bacterium]|nr:sigma-70 family RNA polymerase sigma factor [Solirubrobacterales bacterium]
MSGDFGTAYDQQVKRVYGYFAYRVEARETAEDLTQQTFERALAAWDRFDSSRAPLGAWLMTIAGNLLVDHYRARGAERGDPLEAVPEERLGTVDSESDLGLDADLARALDRLSPRERELLALRFGADMTGPEIAATTELSLANVQQILSRTLRRLRSELETTSVR